MQDIQTKRKFPVQKSAFVFASFALVGGFLEAYTYILHGGVFCNAQTGNLVLFFLGLTRGEWAAASHYLYSILAYIAGILLSAALPLLLKRHSHIAVTAFEIAALAALAFLPAKTPDFYTYASVSFLCAVQYNTFTECRGAKLATTFCTNNLRQAVLGVFSAVKDRDRSALRRAGVYGSMILFFAAGAVAGSFAARGLGNYSALIAAAALLPALALLATWRKRPSPPEGGAPGPAGQVREDCNGAG